MGRRIIICDGAETARLWSRIGAAEGEELSWVPREDESRARPPGFKALAGGLSKEAIEKLDLRFQIADFSVCASHRLYIFCENLVFLLKRFSAVRFIVDDRP